MVTAVDVPDEHSVLLWQTCAYVDDLIATAGRAACVTRRDLDTG